MNLPAFEVFLLLLPTQYAHSMAEGDGCLLSIFLQCTSGAELCVRSSCLFLHWLVGEVEVIKWKGSLEQADFSSGTVWKVRNRLSLATHKVVE